MPPTDDPEARRYEALPALAEETIAELRACQGHLAALRHALARYFKRGYLREFSTGELVDFLGVSANCILDRAGYSAAEGGGAMKVVAELSDEEIKAGPV